MYIDNTITTEFTGYYDSTDEVYVYPSARQDLLLLNVIGADATIPDPPEDEEEIPEEDTSPPSAYLSAMDGDFTTDGATFTHSAGESEDITIGNAISQVISGTLLNPDGLLDGLAFSKNVKAFIGVETATETATIPEGASAYVEYGPGGWQTMPLYAIGSVAYADGNVIRDLGEEIISISALPYLSSTIYFWTASGACLYFDEEEGYVPPSGSTCAQDQRWKYVTDISTTGWGNFMQGKYANTPQSLLMDGTRKYFVAGSKPTVYTWDVEDGTKTTWQYVPMGIFDMSAVSVSGFAYTFEAYDRMILLDADATEWLNTARSTFPENGTIEDFVMALETAAGLPSAYWAGSDSINYDVHASAIISALYLWNTPITYRQIIEWVGEFCGVNARISRFGYLEFYKMSTSGNQPPTITPDVIVGQSREVSRYTIPQITKLVWYNTIGNPIESGTDGSTYTITGNPLPDYALTATAQTLIDNIMNRNLSAIPAYNATSFTDACADPRVDIGDILTVTRTDGTTYLAPIMQYTLTWRGNCVAEYTATGNQTREALQGTTQDAVLAQKLADEKVDKAGDTMTGDLVHDYGGTRKSTISDSLHKVENTSDSTQNATQYYNGFTATDGDDDATLNPTGIAFNHAVGSPSNLRMYTLYHNSSSTAETSYTMDVPSGIYLFLHSRQSTPVSAAQGAQLVTIGTTSGTTALITLLTGGADLTATSGTRSQVSISNTAGGTATVTWTIQGRSYRRLVMVRLM